MVISVLGQNKVEHGCGCYCASGLWSSLRSPGQDFRNDNHSLPLAMCSRVEEHGFGSPILALMAILLPQVSDPALGPRNFQWRRGLFAFLF